MKYILLLPFALLLVAVWRNKRRTKRDRNFKSCLSLMLLFTCLTGDAQMTDSVVKIVGNQKLVYHFNLQKPTWSDGKGRIVYDATVTVYQGSDLICPALPTKYWFDKDPNKDLAYTKRRNPLHSRTGIKGLKRS